MMGLPRHIATAAAVLALHAAAVWALNAGLRMRAVEIVVPVQMLAALVDTPAPVAPVVISPPAPPEPRPVPPPVKQAQPRPVKAAPKPVLKPSPKPAPVLAFTPTTVMTPLPPTVDPTPSPNAPTSTQLASAKPAAAPALAPATTPSAVAPAAACLTILFLYNGKENSGKGSRTWGKWFFYIYYPAHLLLIGIVRTAAGV